LLRNPVKTLREFPRLIVCVSSEPELLEGGLKPGIFWIRGHCSYSYHKLQNPSGGRQRRNRSLSDSECRHRNNSGGERGVRDSLETVTEPGQGKEFAKFSTSLGPIYQEGRETLSALKGQTRSAWTLYRCQRQWDYRVDTRSGSSRVLKRIRYTIYFQQRQLTHG